MNNITGTNATTIVYIINAIIFIVLFFHSSKAKNGLGLQMIQMSLGSMIALCLSISILRVLCYLKIITTSDLMSYTIIPSLVVTGFALYMLGLFARKK
jgi:hypothetical protein